MVARARARQAVVRAVAGGEAVASASAAMEPAETTAAARARRTSTPTRPRPPRRVAASANTAWDSATSPTAKRWGGGWVGGGLECPLHPLAPTLHGARVLGPWEYPFPTGPGDYAQPHVPSPRRGASPTHPHQPPASPLMPLPLPPPPAQPSSKSCHLRYRLNLTCQRHNQAAAQQRAIVRAASRVQTGGGWRGAAGTPVSGCMTASRNASGPTRRGKRPSRSDAT